MRVFVTTDFSPPLRMSNDERGMVKDERTYFDVPCSSFNVFPALISAAKRRSCTPTACTAVRPSRLPTSLPDPPRPPAGPPPPPPLLTRPAGVTPRQHDQDPSPLLQRLPHSAGADHDGPGADPEAQQPKPSLAHVPGDGVSGAASAVPGADDSPSSPSSVSSPRNDSNCSANSA